MSTLRQSIEAKRPGLQPVTVPAWDGVCVYVRRLTIDEYDLFVSLSEKTSEFRRIKALCQLSMCDDAGVRLYGDSDDDTVAAGKLDPRALTVIAQASAQLNLVTDDTVDAAKKNSKGTA